MMCVKEPSAAASQQVFVYTSAVFLKKFYRDLAKARRCRDSEALFHVLNDLFRRAGDGLCFGVRSWDGWFGFYSGFLSFCFWSRRLFWRRGRLPVSACY
jgi:hypothetical protein